MRNSFVILSVRICLRMGKMEGNQMMKVIWFYWFEEWEWAKELNECADGKLNCKIYR